MQQFQSMQVVHMKVRTEKEMTAMHNCWVNLQFRSRALNSKFSQCFAVFCTFLFNTFVKEPHELLIIINLSNQFVVLFISPNKPCAFSLKGDKYKGQRAQHEGESSHSAIASKPIFQKVTGSNLLVAH